MADLKKDADLVALALQIKRATEDLNILIRTGHENNLEVNISFEPVPMQGITIGSPMRELKLLKAIIKMVI